MITVKMNGQVDQTKLISAYQDENHLDARQLEGTKIESQPVVLSAKIEQEPKDEKQSPLSKSCTSPAKGKGIVQRDPPNHDVNKSLEEDIKALTAENEELKSRTLCKVCLDEKIRVLFLPCGHFITCVNCAASVVACPLCRSKIISYVKTNGMM